MCNPKWFNKKLLNMNHPESSGSAVRLKKSREQFFPILYAANDRVQLDAEPLASSAREAEIGCTCLQVVQHQKLESKTKQNGNHDSKSNKHNASA